MNHCWLLLGLGWAVVEGQQWLSSVAVDSKGSENGPRASCLGKASN